MRKLAIVFVLVIRADPFEFHNADRLVDIFAAARVFARVRADATAGVRKRHCLARRLYAFDQPPIFDRLDKRGDIDPIRTGIDARSGDPRRNIAPFIVIACAAFYGKFALKMGDQVQNGIWHGAPDLAFCGLLHYRRRLF